MGPVTLPSFLQCRDRTSKGSSVVPTAVTWFEDMVGCLCFSWQPHFHVEELYVGFFFFLSW